ncbi:MAG TPA: 3-dehydroquinate synthase, partial [bacterium]|nr:3-dehydroquinate synthase [bacterium]
NIVLIGFMGTGKSEVGRLLARRLGWKFVDTDRRVEIQEGASVAQIFARRGEAYFRDAEAKIVAKAIAERDAVIATGGGVVLRPDNMLRLRRHGWIVSLTAPVEVILKRLGEGEGRPLLRTAAGPERALARRRTRTTDVRQTVTRLLAERRPLYRDADLILDVSATTPARAVEAIVAFLGRRERQVIPVRLDDRTYAIYVGDGILPLLPADLGTLEAGAHVAVVSHRPLLRAVGKRLAAALTAWGFAPLVLDVPAGERAKSLAVVSQLSTRLARARFDRGGTVVALGGGVVGDLGGFVAATYMRGIRLVQVPTTLLAMVDSSIGGKTGVNHAGVKNLVGAFHQPAEVLADVRLLTTLPARELRSGMAEVIKTAVIGDPTLFEFLERNLDAVLNRDPRALVEVITHCAAYKSRIVELDERERRQRTILNYGHTIGHAVEAAAGLGRLTHGEAVAIGMALEARLAQQLGLTAAAIVQRQNELIRRAGLPIAAPRVSARALWRAMALDKKVRNGMVRFPLLKGIGDVLLEQEVPETVLREVLAGGTRAGRVRP